jgi:hypothetical protein
MPNAARIVAARAEPRVTERLGLAPAEGELDQAHRAEHLELFDAGQVRRVRPAVPQPPSDRRSQTLR